ncbi:MAG: TlpA family protein disulfide reductase [Phycisphaerales bacterium]|nr:TlpA family protein disulfide reductase [Phycisphaerales bacterium]
MRRSCLYRLFALLAVCTLAAPSLRADVSVGDTPEYSYTDMNGEEITSEDLRGRFVFVLFWVSRDEDCITALVALWVLIEMPESGEQSGFIADLRARILVIAADGLRQDRNVRRGLQAAEFTGSVLYDREGSGAEMANTWGISSVPTLYLIAPNGSVLYRYEGTAQDIFMGMREINADSLLSDYPPLTSDERAAAESALASAESLLDAGEPEKAVSAIRGFHRHAADYFEEIGDRYRAIAEQLDPLGQAELDDVRALVKQAGYDESARRQATAALQRLARKYAGLPIGQAIEDDIHRMEHSDLLARREAGRAYEARVNRALARAEALIAAGRRIDAHRKLSFILDRFPSANSTRRAKHILDDLEADPGFIAERQARRIRLACEKLLSETENLLDAGDAAGAEAKLLEIIEQYPDSDYAATAREKLDELD